MVNCYFNCECIDMKWKRNKSKFFFKFFKVIFGIRSYGFFFRLRGCCNKIVFKIY